MDVFHMQIYYQSFPVQFEQTQDKRYTNLRWTHPDMPLGTFVPLHEPVVNMLEQTLSSAVARDSQPIKKQQLRTCSTSNKTFSTLSNLKRHLLLHKDDSRSHQCSFCGKSFTQKSSLQTHIRVHTGEKPFTCKYCPRSFTDMSTRNKHERIHSGECPYVCKDCGKGFKDSGNLIRHRKSFHLNL